MCKALSSITSTEKIVILKKGGLRTHMTQRVQLWDLFVLCVWVFCLHIREWRSEDNFHVSLHRPETGSPVQCMYVCALCACSIHSSQKRVWITWDRSYRWLRATMGMARNWTWDHWASSSDPYRTILIIWFFGITVFVCLFVFNKVFFCF